MEDVESDDAARDRTVHGELIRKASTTTNEEDVELVYDHNCFGGIRSGADTSATIMGVRSLLREAPP
jgi:hypothetical protein